MTADLFAHPNLLLIVGIILLVSIVARRIPLLRTVFAIATWVALAGVLFVVIGQRERFDPYVARIAAALDLDSQSVAGGETRIPMARDGHFYVRATIGGMERRMLVDSGATLTALSERTVAQAGLTVRPTAFPMLIKTANGTIRADTTEIGELRMGNIIARDLAAVVSPAFGDTDILGMNFLSRLKSWRVEGRTMILVPNHPQGADVRS